MMKIITPLLALTLALASTVADAQVPAPTRPNWFSMPNASEFRKSAKKVFAHYMPNFPIQINNLPVQDDYYGSQYLSPDGEGGKFRDVGGFIRERPLPVANAGQPTAANWEFENQKTEVRRAIMIGIDGFDVDILDTRGQLWDRFLSMLKAANAVDPNFKIMFKPDMFAGLSQNPDALYSALMQIKNSPALFRLPDGRIVVSPYGADAQPVSYWKKMLARWTAAGVRVAFVPCVQNWRDYAPQIAPIAYGIMQWGSDQSADRVGVMKQLRLSVYANTVTPQYFRPNAKLYIEYNNSETYRKDWERLISNDVDWINVATWNDYSECTEISPSTGIGTSLFELTGYYASWFKTGVQPTIHKDRLILLHHGELTGANLAQLSLSDLVSTEAAMPDRVTFRIWGAPKDDLEVLAFLVAPGSVQINTGTQTYQFNGVAGQNVFRVPVQPGQVNVTLTRGLTNVVATSATTVTMPGQYPNLLYRGGAFGNP